ncbi:hypothetical protein LCGC14_2244830, partial [marine sediment metagenome]
IYTRQLAEPIRKFGAVTTAAPMLLRLDDGGTTEQVVPVGEPEPSASTHRALS